MDLVDAAIEAYAEAHTTPPPPHLLALAAETNERLRSPQMMVGSLEGRFLEMLAFTSGAQTILEIGTFSGYSSLSMAAGLAPGGRIITCDLDPVALEVARRHIGASPYADRIEIREGPALDTIASLDGPFDLVFVDADKTNYPNYYDAVLPKLAPRGLLAFDNVLWSGRVLDEADQSPDTVAIRTLNDTVRADDRVTCVLVTIRDGVLLVRKNP